jgi:hypothetical protein
MEEWDTNLYIWNLESRERRNSYNGPCLLDPDICYTLRYLIVVTGLLTLISGIFPFLKMQNTDLLFHCAIFVCVCVCVCMCLQGLLLFNFRKSRQIFMKIFYEYYVIEIIPVCDFVYSVTIAWRLLKPTNSIV